MSVQLFIGLIEQPLQKLFAVELQMRCHSVPTFNVSCAGMVMWC